MPVLDGAMCYRCGDPLHVPACENEPAATICRTCRLAPPAFVRAVAYALYQGRMRSAIHALKYDGMRPAARRLGGMLAQAMVRLQPEAPAAMLIVPVPLHRLKNVERGFNQARLLALHALKTLKKTHPAWRLIMAPDTLMRLRATESQAALSPRQRRLNVRGAFVVSDPGAIEGRDTLLVDDILTTGATARAAAQVLMQAGAASVWVATLARARRIYERRGSIATYQAASPHDSYFDSREQDDTAVDEPQETSTLSGNQPSF